MPANLVFKVARAYLEVILKNPRKDGTAVFTFSELWSRSAAQCHIAERIRVMARLQLRRKQTVESAYHIARSAAESGWKRDYKLALVARLEDHFYFTLIRDFLTHEGFEVALFSNRRTAKKWLVSDM